MKAIVWHGGWDFRLTEIDPPAPGPGQIVVRVKAAGVCRSDFELDLYGVSPPAIPGHEAAGVVNSVGEGVQGLSIGQAVALDPVQICGNCWCCTNDLGHQCLNVRHLGGLDYSGCWAELVAVDARNAYVLPGNLDIVAGCLTEPVAVCYHTFTRSQWKPGTQVLIVGDGPFGFLHAQIARALDAGKIIVAGHRDERLRRIADHTGAVVCNSRTHDLFSLLEQEIGSPGVDLAIEASGGRDAPNIGVRAVRPGGTVAIFSHIWNPEPLDLDSTFMRELNILGVCRSWKAFKPSLEMMSKGSVDVKALADLEIPLEDFDCSFDRLRDRAQKMFKVILKP